MKRDGWSHTCHQCRLVHKGHPDIPADRYAIRQWKTIPIAYVSHKLAWICPTCLQKNARTRNALVSAYCSRHEGIVYFLKANCKPNAFKVGFCVSYDNLPKRLSSLQIGSAYDVSMVAWMPGGHNLEHAIHKSLNKWHIRGEWFRRNPFLTDFLTRLKKTNGLWEHYYNRLSGNHSQEWCEWWMSDMKHYLRFPKWGKTARSRRPKVLESA